MCAWGFAGALGSSMIGALASNASSKKQFKYQSALQRQAAKLNYQYGLKSLENSPTSERKGLETAGYNPMLAVQNATSGANSGWTSTGQAQNVDYGQAISNAFDFKRLENESMTSKSTANLQNEQAKTEQAKRVNLNFDSMMKDAERRLKDTEISSYDRRVNAEIYRNMQEAERARGEASVIAYNAETNRIIANAQHTNAEVNKQWTPGKIGAGIVTGLGVGTMSAIGPGKFFKGAKAIGNGAKAVKKSSPHVQKVIKDLHTFGKTRKH